MVAMVLSAAITWSSVLSIVVTQVPRVEMRLGDQGGVCSAVIYEIDKDGYALALTAAHCVDKQPDQRLDLTVNGRTAVAVASNSLLDLAIVRVRARSETAIPLAAVSPEMGSDVAVVGYAFGVEQPVAQFGRVAQTYNRETKAIWIDAMMIFGDSGGAVVDANGALIAITSRIYTGGMMGQAAHIAAAVPIEAIHDFIDEFRANEKKRAK